MAHKPHETLNLQIVRGRISNQSTTLGYVYYCINISLLPQTVEYEVRPENRKSSKHWSHTTTYCRRTPLAFTTPIIDRTAWLSQLAFEAKQQPLYRNGTHTPKNLALLQRLKENSQFLFFPHTTINPRPCVLYHRVPCTTACYYDSKSMIRAIDNALYSIWRNSNTYTSSIDRSTTGGLVCLLLSSHATSTSSTWKKKKRNKKMIVIIIKKQKKRERGVRTRRATIRLKNVGDPDDDKR